jgi:hypothetical protein
MAESKVCSKCKLEKPVDLYGFAYANVRKSKCKACINAYSLEYRKKNPNANRDWKERNKEIRNAWRRAFNKTPEQQKKRREYSLARAKEKIKSSKLQSKYGITIEIFRQMLADQNEQCKICLKPQIENVRSVLYVDHCHETGKVRGLLCQQCNSLLGNAKDNLQILFKAIDYLKGA